MKLRLALLLLIVPLFVTTACAQGPAIAITTPEGHDRAIIRVEIANTEPERETGLMYRNHLDANAGMIFVFSAPAHQSFWMKNTEIPLDMIFADGAGRIIGIVANAAPYTLSADEVEGESQYVIEVNGGFCQAHGIGPGDRLRFIGFSPSASD